MPTTPTRLTATSASRLRPPDRPWIYSNFVQSLDGITTLLGKHGSGGEISQSREDRWLMDLLRAHADGLLMGMNTLLEEQRLSRSREPGHRLPGRRSRAAGAARPAGQRARAEHLRHPRGRSRSLAATKSSMATWWMRRFLLRLPAPIGLRAQGSSSACRDPCRRRRRNLRLAACHPEAARRTWREVPAVRRRANALRQSGARRSGGREVHDRLAHRSRTNRPPRAGAPCQRASLFAAASTNCLRRPGIYKGEHDALDVAELPQGRRSPVQSLPAETRG